MEGWVLLMGSSMISFLSPSLPLSVIPVLFFLPFQCHLILSLPSFPSHSYVLFFLVSFFSFLSFFPLLAIFFPVFMLHPLLFPSQAFLSSLLLPLSPSPLFITVFSSSSSSAFLPCGRKKSGFCSAFRHLKTCIAALFDYFCPSAGIVVFSGPFFLSVHVKAIEMMTMDVS